jgi:hypothetical protein
MRRRSPSRSIDWAKPLSANSDAKVPFAIKVIDTEDVKSLRFRAAFSTSTPV